MSLHATRRRVHTAVAMTAATGLVAAGCGGPDGEGESARDTLVIYMGVAGDLQRNFNPYSTGMMEGQGTIFEPLFFFNIARRDEPVPRLGTEFSWNDEGTELSITLREGVEWSDGEDFTADDVVFTFDMLLDHEAINTIGFAGQTEIIDPHHVMVSFDEPAYMIAPQLLGKTWIVPEHIWSGIDDPAGNTTSQPVGTGPFTLSDFQRRTFTLSANPTYWDGETELKHVRYEALEDTAASIEAMGEGEVDWMTAPVPDLENVEENYPGYKVITIPMNQLVLTSCASTGLGCEGPQTDPAVRQAIYHAMDRDEINRAAFQDTASEISPGFALPERDAAYISTALSHRTAPMTPDVPRAEEILEDAGYTRGSDGIFARDGRRLSLTVRVVSAWTDYIAALETLTEQLREAGIELNIRKSPWEELTQARNHGDYQLVMDSVTQGPAPDPYFVYKHYLHSENTAAVGQPAYANPARYTNEDVDRALDELAQLKPEDTNTRLPYYDEVQAQIEEDMPYIPILTGGTTSEFRAEKFTGWPTEVNLYAFPNVWSRPDQSQIFMKLSPVRKD